LSSQGRVRRLFEGGEVAATARLRLSLASPGDIDGLPWLAAALSPEWEPADIEAPAGAGECVVIWRTDGAPIGLAVAVAGQPNAGSACISLLAIEPAERFRGLGGEAALALEGRMLDSWRSRVVLAPVPEGRGLAVYFWLRLGYRPLLRADAPWPLVSLGGRSVRGIWMARARPGDRH